MSRTKNGTDLSKSANVAASMTKAPAVKRGRKPTIHETRTGVHREKQHPHVQACSARSSHTNEPVLCEEPEWKCEHRPFYFEQEGGTDEEPMELGAMPMHRLLPEVYRRVENAIEDVQTLDALLGHHLARRFPENVDIPPLPYAQSSDGQSEYEHALLGILNLVEKLKREIELIRLRVR